jgi:preflagellin peptidase FlaK
VDTEELLWISAFVVTMAVLISASICDWKEREIPDRHWAVLGAAGLAVAVLVSVHLTGFKWEYILLAAGTAMILMDILWDRDFNPLLFYALMALLFIIPLFSGMPDDITMAWASVPVCYIIYVGLYYFGVVKGGADAKCLIVLSIMFPMYPHFLGSPLLEVPHGIVSQIFVFSVSVLFVAAVMTIPIVLYFVIRNAKEGMISRRMVSGYRMDLSKAMDTDVWPLEDIVDGERRFIKIPKEEEMEDIYARLKDAGCEKVWVTPMIPFVVMMAAAVAIVALIGNPLFLIA